MAEIPSTQKFSEILGVLYASAVKTVAAICHNVISHMRKAITARLRAKRTVHDERGELTRVIERDRMLSVMPFVAGGLVPRVSASSPANRASLIARKGD